MNENIQSDDDRPAGVPPSLRAGRASAALRKGEMISRTGAAVSLRNCTRVVVWGQAGWVVISFTVGGDLVGPTAQCVFSEVLVGSCFSGTKGHSVISWHSYTEPYCGHALVSPTLIRSRHHPSPPHPSIEDPDSLFSLPLSVSLSNADSRSP